MCMSFANQFSFIILKKISKDTDWFLQHTFYMYTNLYSF